MRAPAALALAMTLALAACGSDSGDKADTSSKATTGTAKTATGKTDTTTKTTQTSPGKDGKTGGATGPTTTRESGSGKVKFKPVAPPKTGAAKFPPGERAVYRLGEKTCGAGKPRQVGRKYGIKGSNPYQVAFAFAKKNAKQSAQDAAFAGCLAGFGLK